MATIRIIPNMKDKRPPRNKMLTIFSLVIVAILIFSMIASAISLIR